MKILLFVIFQFIGYSDRIDGYEQIPINSLQPTIEDCGDVPDLNKDIVSFAKSKIKKKVGRGECWDLANEALLSVDATWDGRYAFGREVDYKNECVFAGDIIQFENVKTVIKEGTRTDYQEFPHHTAIIYEVKGPGKFVLAHQNTTTTGKKVGLSDLDLANVVKGKFHIYRPVQ